MPEVYIVNLSQINPLRRAVGVSLLAVGYVVVIDLPVQLAMGEVQLNRLVSFRFSVVLEESSCLVNDFSGMIVSPVSSLNSRTIDSSIVLPFSTLPPIKL